ncbi:methionyl-tRNA synthetase [Pedobacter sp. BAL39]|uniref:methionyl-tRNA synthetase n=1 Tax=Pedobacter sp. BAL39 TaxID=391596 RepID=UPI000155A4A8|nr:methionyl-tRNA synthetase [Pedobacter sp. BAL39]EDM34498.1 methionyl-tRNA synthetase [Pedobacter sp. BAL39]
MLITYGRNKLLLDAEVSERAGVILELKDGEKALIIARERDGDILERQKEAQRKGQEKTETGWHILGYVSLLLWKRNLDFQIISGQRPSITGVDGTEKTTLMKLILAETDPEENVDILISAINEYVGTLIVISHDPVSCNKFRWRMQLC